MATSVSAVYLHVVDSVVTKLRDEFLSEGVDASVLTELQGLWELKMVQCGAIRGSLGQNSAPRPGASITPVHDLNMPYEGPEEYETPTAEMLFPPTPIQTPLPADPVAYPYYPPGPSDFVPIPDIGPGSGTDIRGGKPASYMSSPWMNQRPVGVDVNIAYEEGREDRTTTGQAPMTKDFFMMTSGKRKRDDYTSGVLPGGYIPQQDGSGDSELVSSGPKNVVSGVLPPDRISENNQCDSQRLQDRIHADATIASLVKAKHNIASIPQYDGLHDIYEDDVSNEDYNASYYDPLSPQNVATPKPAKTEAADDDDEPPLNEDDDDDDDLDDLGQGDEEPSINHLVLAQFEKVNRTKSRWRCTLKDGIMHLNNKDILFAKATGEFEF